MRVLVTGSRGFIGKNLCLRLEEMPDVCVLRFDRDDPPELLAQRIAQADVVVHLAGENRPRDPADLVRGNAELTAALCEAIRLGGRTVPLLLASSIQATLDNPYGRSKRAAEVAAEGLAATGNPVVVYRLPGVFGKWCRPDYNSVVATFCHNIARDLPIRIDNPAAIVRLVYVDDVINSFIADLAAAPEGVCFREVAPVHAVGLGELAAQIRAFRSCRDNLVIERVGAGFVHALYATYVSYLPPTQFSYRLPLHADKRGVFVEMLKTADSGQFSFFTSLPGVTRGSHYHHSKSEKFLVIKGRALFRFRHVLTGERHQIETEGGCPEVVETVPGWTHEVTNVGEDEMVVMLWANENYDPARPDTIPCKV